MQNTNDVDLDINKGIDMIFDERESKLEYIQYCYKVLDHTLKNEVLPEDSCAVFEEIIGKGKEFLISCAKNLEKISTEESQQDKDLETFLRMVLEFERKLGESMQIKEKEIVDEKGKRFFEENRFGFEV